MSPTYTLAAILMARGDRLHREYTRQAAARGHASPDAAATWARWERVARACRYLLARMGR